MDRKPLAGISRIRKLVQAGWGILQNGWFAGFASGEIYNGPLKKFCVPGLNCYSCPGALGACPIGSMQAFLTSRRVSFPFYVLGFLMGIGVLAGRFICGWLCLFGLVQELLYMIPVKKWTIPEKADKLLRYLKYVFLFGVVILMPIILRDEMGMSAPFFCKYICPAGMLEGGIPLLILNKAMRPAAHFLYVWKLGILLVVVVMSIFIHRPFCKYICPLGAFYGMFQKISFLKLHVNSDSCINCGKCASVCHMQVNPVRNPNSAECIRCGKCVKTCPAGALHFSVREQKSGIRHGSRL